MPTAATSDQVKPAIQLRGGRYGNQPRVPFFTGGVDGLGRRNVAFRKPQQRRFNGVSAWAVRYSGTAVLVDPEVINGTTVFNISYSQI